MASVSGGADATPRIEGATDGTLIGNVSDRMKVDASITSASGGVISSYSKKTRVEVLTTPISITSSSSYTTVYTRSGSGLLIGFNLEFNNTAIVVKIDCDGDVILDGTDIGAFNLFLVTANDTIRRQSGSGVVTSSSTIDWSLRNPIAYATSLTISARLTSGATARTFNQGIVYLTKET